MKRGFTLIELLVVVAIIAVLAAIAVPNFLEAQTRSKVARVKADQRTVATALESYCVDMNKYPSGRVTGWGDSLTGCWCLTTPVAYVGGFAKDPFDPNSSDYSLGQKYSQKYFCYQDNSAWATDPAVHLGTRPLGFRRGWVVESWGPDQKDDGGEWYPPNMAEAKHQATACNFLYDPTNGTVSAGDVPRYGGDLPFSQTL